MIKKHIENNIYPNTPPSVLRITSSTSHDPSFVTSCVNSIVTEYKKLKTVILKKLLNLYDIIGTTNPNGIKHNTLPNKLSIPPKPLMLLYPYLLINYSL